MNYEGGRACQVEGTTCTKAASSGKAFRILRGAKEAGVERVGKSVEIRLGLAAMGTSWDLS